MSFHFKHQLEEDNAKLKKENEELKLFRDNIMAIMSESYRDGMSRASMGLDFDFEWSRTKLNIERGNFYYAQGKTLPAIEKGGQGE